MVAAPIESRKYFYVFIRTDYFHGMPNQKDPLDTQIRWITKNKKYFNNIITAMYKLLSTNYALKTESHI